MTPCAQPLRTRLAAASSPTLSAASLKRRSACGSPVKAATVRMEAKSSDTNAFSAALETDSLCAARAAARLEASEMAAITGTRDSCTSESRQL